MARKKKEKIVVFESDFQIDAPPPIFTDVEREIIRADMAFLIQKEKDSGDWSKWEASQRELEYPTSPTQRPVYIDANGTVTNDPARIRRRVTRNQAMPITMERFIAAVGREPQLDEFDRVNCAAHGTVGHWSCGWCNECEKPFFMCNHLNRG